jgi:lysine 2,3-aminomutase
LAFYILWQEKHAAYLTPFKGPSFRPKRKSPAPQAVSDHGISMISQTVPLKDVNDDTQTPTDLFYGLREINVKPYYLLQCDPVRGRNISAPR